MMMTTTMQKMMTAPGDSFILVSESSLNLVNPPPLEGMCILSSAMGVYFKMSIIYLSEFL